MIRLFPALPIWRWSLFPHSVWAGPISWLVLIKRMWQDLVELQEPKVLASTILESFCSQVKKSNLNNHILREVQPPSKPSQLRLHPCEWDNLRSTSSAEPSADCDHRSKFRQDHRSKFSRIMWNDKLLLFQATKFWGNMNLLISHTRTYLLRIMSTAS